MLLWINFLGKFLGLSEEGSFFLEIFGFARLTKFFPEIFSENFRGTYQLNYFHLEKKRERIRIRISIRIIIRIIIYILIRLIIRL